MSDTPYCSATGIGKMLAYAQSTEAEGKLCWGALKLWLGNFLGTDIFPIVEKWTQLNNG